MNLLVIVSNYPHAGHICSGAFNESSVQALRALGHQVTVLAPRPYAPRVLAACHSRWQAYRQMSAYEIRASVPVYRPAFLQVPLLGGSFWLDHGAELFCARTVEGLHCKQKFDAILSYNLVGAGGLAWRLADRLGIPAVGWATGNDMRMRTGTSYARAVRRALERLDIVFYQSAELRQLAANLLGGAGESMNGDRHVVLPRGIECPPAPAQDIRARMRAQLNLRPEQIVVLYIGRIVAAKGVFDLAQAAASLLAEDRDLVFLLVGAKPGFDESARLGEMLTRQSLLANGVRMLPECVHAEVWDYLAAADIFAFPSYSEGMPNSLLEAMAAGVPALTYAIPPAIEIDGGREILKMARPRDIDDLSRALSELAASSERRASFAQRAKQRLSERYMARQNLMEAVRRINRYNGQSKASRNRLTKKLPPSQRAANFES